LKYFQQITKQAEAGKQNAVIMGRTTWFSLPETSKPLKQRLNCILSHTMDFGDLIEHESTLVFSDLETCLAEVAQRDDVDQIFIIGGAKLYNSVLHHPLIHRLYVTKVEGDFDCDTFFAGIPEEFQVVEQSETKEENGISFRFLIYER